MSYILQSDLRGMIPDAFLVQALDDNGDGQPDIGVWDDVAKAVQEAIDGALGAVYAVPFAAPVPSVILDAAKVFACELLYKRRGYIDANNPWAKTAADMRTRLKGISDLKEKIPGLNLTAPAPILISEPAKTTVTSGRILS